MRIVAASWVLRSESMVLHPAMVTLSDVYVSDYSAIEDDMPLMEWIGGMVFLSAKEDLADLPEQVSLDELKAYLLSDDMPRYAYHLVGVDIDSKDCFNSELVVQLEEDFI